MNNINLDINNYQLNELERLFKLGDNYTEFEITNKKDQLEVTIKQSIMSEREKQGYLIFLDNIRNKLTENLIYQKAIREDKSINLVNKYDGNHFVMKNENNEYSSVLENNKKINKSIIKHSYTIDSLFRPNYDNANITSDDFMIELPSTIHNAVTMTISSLQIPLTYYNISQQLNNNMFTIELRILDGVGGFTVQNSWDIILTDGLYESVFTSSFQRKAQSISDEINRQISTIKLNDASVEAANISDYLQFNVNLKSGNSVFTYRNGLAINSLVLPARDAYNLRENVQIYINFNVNNPQSNISCRENKLYQKLGWQLGFRQNSIVLDENSVFFSNFFDSDLNTTYEIGSILSSAICAIQYPRYLYLAIDDYQTSSRNYFSVAAASNIAPNIIAKINILSMLEEKTAFKSGSEAGDALYQQKHIREYFGPTDIKKLRVSLLDEFGRPFSLNNMDWNFVATWECFYN